jgi:hypothetical protein
VTVLLGTNAAAAEVRVVVEGCGEIDVAEVERLVDLDLATVLDARDPPDARDGERARFPPARVTCEGGKMTILVADPVTDKRLERTLPAPKPREGRERTIALAVSQLYVTSWAELLIPPPPEPVGPPPAPKSVAAAARRVVRRKIKAAEPGSWELALLVAVRIRDLDRGYGTLATGLRPSLAFAGPFRAFFQASFESGQAQRSRGAVDVTLAAVGGGVAIREPRVGLFAIDGWAGASLLYARLDGRPTAERTSGQGASGTALDFAVGVGPTLRLGPFRAGLEAQAGYTVPRLEGRVIGDDAVRASGPWFGGGVHLGLAFGGD